MRGGRGPHLRGLEVAGGQAEGEQLLADTLVVRIELGGFSKRRHGVGVASPVRRGRQRSP